MTKKMCCTPYPNSGKSLSIIFIIWYLLDKFLQTGFLALKTGKKYENKSFEIVKCYKLFFS